MYIIVHLYLLLFLIFYPLSHFLIFVTLCDDTLIMYTYTLHFMYPVSCIPCRHHGTHISTSMSYVVWFILHTSYLHVHIPHDTLILLVLLDETRNINLVKWATWYLYILMQLGTLNTVSYCVFWESYINKITLLIVHNSSKWLTYYLWLHSLDT